MKPETLIALTSMIKSMLALDGTVSQAETTIILDVCKNPITRSDTASTTTATEYLSPKDVAKKMHVSGRTVRRWISTGTLPSKKINGVRRIPDTAVDDLGGNALLPHRRNTTSAVHRSQALNGKTK
jgi:excisionase family DNA binding protein